MARLRLIALGATVPFVVAFVATPVAAQIEAPVSRHGCAPAITPSAACFRELDSRARDHGSRARAPDHRYEGMAVGGGLGFVGGLLLGLAICGQSEDPNSSGAGCVIAGGLGMGVLVGFVGMMIGAQFPKEEATPEGAAPRDSVAQ